MTSLGVIISFKLLFLLKASLAVFLKQIFESKKQQRISLRKGSNNNQLLCTYVLTHKKYKLRKLKIISFFLK
jgi:hypothetical protein